MNNYYDSISKGYVELHKEEQKKKLAILKEYLDIEKNQKLLDVGCGPGFSAEYFDCQITGVDPSIELLGTCPFKTILGSAENLPFNDEEFDVVISVTAIQNFFDIEKGLKEIRRVGKRFGLTVLKKSSNIKTIRSLIRTIFSVEKEIDEDKDLIFIAKP